MRTRALDTNERENEEKGVIKRISGMMEIDYQALCICLTGMMNQCVVGPSKVYCRSLKAFERLDVNTESSRCTQNHDELIESSVYVGGAGKI